MNVKVLLNPYANRWHAQSQVPRIERALQNAGIQYDLTLIPAPKAGIQLAYEAAQQGYDALVAAGGDGTFNEVLNGVIRATEIDQPTMPCGLIPIGTGNDFGEMTGLAYSIERNVEIIAQGKVKQIDAGQVNDYYFHNNCAVAMEPMVNLESNKITRISGKLRYVLAMIRALINLKAWHMRIQWDDGEMITPTYLLSVCNSPRTGGSFLISPPAKMDDGLFDVIHTPEVPKTAVLSIVLGLLKGTHLNHPAVQRLRTTQLTIDSQPGTPIHADGEMVSESLQHIHYQILPGKITLFTP